jgi:hypothetical protein
VTAGYPTDAPGQVLPDHRRELPGRGHRVSWRLDVRYRIYQAPSLKPNALKQGFVWQAFLVPELWLVHRRLYIDAAVTSSSGARRL